MDFTTRCARCNGEKGCCYCWPCHKLVVEEIHKRQALPVGGMSHPRCEEQYEEERVVAVVAPEDGPTLRQCKEIIDDARRTLHVRGSTFTPLDDMGPWQEIAIRCWEEACA